MSIKYIITLVLETLELTHQYDREVLPLSRTQREHADARSIIFKIADFAGYKVNEVSQGLKCKESIGKASLERFYRRIKSDPFLEIKFNKCFEKYELEANSLLK